ncbi:GntR family transcriptional regulator [Sutterella sp.]|uniref:GntR family transcriptional regulator n=1 Tax=Sutterella sp. TaxID=1981025 RepID=UPI0026DEADDF|nr:GntR family transcriptional regulator [Sutterella sp.]MDO5532252.1 GntR family transcriptional regulator [Sutterella sp.]
MAKELLQDKLAQKLIDGIRSGRHPVGSLLPKEMELVETEGVSRHTVRAALSKLENLGLIKRTPHVGTLVVSRGKLQHFDQSLSTLSDLDRLAEANPRRILDIREIVVSRELGEQIQCPPGETYLRFSMIRLAKKRGEPPIAWTTEYVERAFQRLVTEAPKQPGKLMIELIGELFGRRCAEVRQTIEATTLTEEAAANLGAEVGAPCLRILRHYVTARGKTLLTTVSYHPADRYAFTLNVKLDRDGWSQIGNFDE